MPPLTREEVCKSKVSYTYKSQAKAALKLLKSQKRFWSKELHVYRCNICSKFHLGRTSDNIDNLFDQINKKEEK